MSNAYLDRLDEQEDQMNTTQSLALEVLDNLEELIKTAEDKSAEDDSTGLNVLETLRSKNKELLKSITMTRVLQLNATEKRAELLKNPDLTTSKLFLSPDDRNHPDNLFNYFEEGKLLHETWMRHLSLISNLSDDLVVKLESHDDSNLVVTNKDPLPPVLKNTIRKYEELGPEQQHIEDIRATLFQYLDDIKAGRAKYALENKYILNTSLQEITKEVSEWSQRWTNIENTLFGDSPNSLKKLIQKADEIKELLSSDSIDSSPAV
ncbi:hypothetical protein C6P41_004487 [Kluyveromyces marxianus]|nr:hypothetical protein C6P43_003707 [Kluyveromyces marxianus]KAG0685479.1 hypothetical protein C6P41_004487 [Kluyveromyces marxianus]